ncbi:hypothetical protein KJ912_02350, partial [Patescibacteria group bacterium]|nr:hypothetical protein [Patescibacteria group bacterium]
MINLLPPEQLEKIKIIQLSKRTMKVIFIIVFLNAGILIYLGYLRSSLKNELETSSSVSLNQDAEKKA